MESTAVAEEAAKAAEAATEAKLIAAEAEASSAEAKADVAIEKIAEVSEEMKIGDEEVLTAALVADAEIAEKISGHKEIEEWQTERITELTLEMEQVKGLAMEMVNFLSSPPETSTEMAPEAMPEPESSPSESEAVPVEVQTEEVAEAPPEEKPKPKKRRFI